MNVEDERKKVVEKVLTVVKEEWAKKGVFVTLTPTEESVAVDAYLAALSRLEACTSALAGWLQAAEQGEVLPWLRAPGVVLRGEVESSPVRPWVGGGRRTGASSVTVWIRAESAEQVLHYLATAGPPIPQEADDALKAFSIQLRAIVREVSGDRGVYARAGQGELCEDLARLFLGFLETRVPGPGSTGEDLRAAESLGANLRAALLEPELEVNEGGDKVEVSLTEQQLGVLKKTLLERSDLRPKSSQRQALETAVGLARKVGSRRVLALPVPVAQWLGELTPYTPYLTVGHHDHTALFRVTGACKQALRGPVAASS